MQMYLVLKNCLDLPFCTNAQWSHVILISPNIGEGMVPSPPSLCMQTLCKEGDTHIKMHVNSKRGIFMVLVIFGWKSQKFPNSSSQLPERATNMKILKWTSKWYLTLPRPVPNILKQNHLVNVRQSKSDLGVRLKWGPYLFLSLNSNLGSFYLLGNSTVQRSSDHGIQKETGEIRVRDRTPWMDKRA